MKIKELEKINQRYLNSYYSISKGELKKVNHLIKWIESTRDNEKPKTGDIVQFTSEHGEYYGNALISKVWEDGDIEICEVPYVPFIGSYDEKTKNIRMSVSGGAFHNFKQDMFKYIGKGKRKFCDWGECGACADGAIDFIATVNVWEVKQQNRYEPYTTEKYNKMYIHKNINGHESYKILGEGIAFETEEDYTAFLNTYRAKEFLMNEENCAVIFYYKEENFYLSKEEWDKIKKCEIDTRRCNCSIITVKVKYDDKNKKIKVYRYSNRFEPNEEISDKPYILNREDKLNKERKIGK